MKIAWINFDMSDCGGSQQVLANIVNALYKEHELFVISLIQANEVWQYHFSERVHCETILPHKARIRETISAGKKKLVEYLQKNQIELVFYVGAYAGLCASVMARKVKCHKVFCDHGALMNQWNEIPARVMRTAGSFLSDKTVVLTKQSEKAYYEKFHYKKGRVTTIYNWMDDRILENAGVYDDASAKIITAGRFSHEKGYDLLVDTAYKLKQLKNDWEWDIYGTGDMFDEIKKEIADKGLSEHIHLLGLTREMEKCYKNHALYVLTSYREGLPLVLIEAKANHLPIVSFDIISGPGEIITNEMDGVLIPPYDTDKMAYVISELLSDREKRRRMSENSAHNIKLFQKENILEQWRNLISEFSG